MTNKSDNIAYARLNPTEKELLQAIMKIEGMNKSSAIRHLIRLGARIYGLLPSVDYSQQVEQTANDLLVCEKCGQEFGR